MKYLIQGRKERGRLKASVHLIWAQTELLKKRRKTYISMKMEPNGRIPPRQTMTAGSMNLPGHNVRPQNQTRSILCDEEERKERARQAGYSSAVWLTVASSHLEPISCWQPATVPQSLVNVNTLPVYCLAVFHYPKSLFRRWNRAPLRSWGGTLRQRSYNSSTIHFEHRAQRPGRPPVGCYESLHSHKYTVRDEDWGDHS